VETEASITSAGISSMVDVDCVRIAHFNPNSEVAGGFIGILTTDYRHFIDLTSRGSYTREAQSQNFVRKE
jgi:hypothetical protein